ncbi:MAG: DUF116 domain-containing protein [Planctomycetota bacterium]
MQYDDAFFKQFDEFLAFFSEGRKHEGQVREFHQEFVTRKNDRNVAAFQRIPFERRIILMPQCLRRLGECRAVEEGYFFACKRCGHCAVDAIIKRADELGYMGAFVLKGGRAVKEIIRNRQPEGILGVACWYEGFLGIVECENRGVAVTFYPLSKDGCAGTEVNIQGLLAFMGRLELPGTTVR